jgi:hypothetical protein
MAEDCKPCPITRKTRTAGAILARTGVQSHGVQSGVKPPQRDLGPDPTKPMSLLPSEVREMSCKPWGHKGVMACAHVIQGQTT